MAYLPRFNHDLFLSYAHEDAGWVRGLEKELAAKFTDSLPGCEIWQDERRLRTGQDWPEELKAAIRGSAAFVSVLSRNNVGTGWCGRELAIFLDQAHRDRETIAANGFGRLLKVIKFPWVNDAHKGFHGNYQHVDFFENGNLGPQSFKTNRAAFEQAVAKLSFHISELFDAILRNMEKVFVARAVAEAAAERTKLISEIRAAGYALSPPPFGEIADGLDVGTIGGFVNEASATVHLIGATGDDSVREQIDLCREAEKKVIFCLLPGHEDAIGDHASLIDDIRKNRLDIPKDHFRVLENRSAVALRQELIAELQPPKPSAPVGPGNAKKLVYLMCDPTTAEDVACASDIQGKIHEKKSRLGIKVELPATDAFVRPAQHERLLHGADGLLLVRERAPDKWFQLNLADLLREQADRRQHLQKGMLVPAAFELPGVTVIQRTRPFLLQQLTPFLAPLIGDGR